MPNYTENLQLEQPLDEEQYDVAVTRRNNQKIDDFSQTMPKLYSESGDNIDGAMTQKASTDYIKEVIEILYPVGSIYIGTQATCPFEILGIGTWQLVAADKTLQGSSETHSANSIIDASLPSLTSSGAGAHSHTKGTMNITGRIYNYAHQSTGADGSPVGTGAFHWASDGTKYSYAQSGLRDGYDIMDFDANRSWTGNTSSVLNHTHTIEWTNHVGTTVQPNAYVVNVWRRVA